MMGLSSVSCLVAALLAFQPGGQVKTKPEEKRKAPNKKIMRIAHRIAHTYYDEMFEYGYWLPMLQNIVATRKSGKPIVLDDPNSPYSDPEYFMEELARNEDEVKYMARRKRLMEENLDEWEPRLILGKVDYFSAGYVDCKRTARGEKRELPKVVKVVGKDGLLILSSHWPFDRPCPYKSLPKPNALLFRNVPTKGIKSGQRIKLSGLFECTSYGRYFQTKEFGRLAGTILKPVRKADFKEALIHGRDLIRSGKCGPKQCELCMEIGKRRGRIVLESWR